MLDAQVIKNGFDKIVGKGFVGGAVGLAVSTFLFKSKSPIAILALTGGGFIVERMIKHQINKTRISYPEEIGYFDNAPTSEQNTLETNIADSPVEVNRYFSESELNSESAADVNLEADISL